MLKIRQNILNRIQTMNFPIGHVCCIYCTLLSYNTLANLWLSCNSMYRATKFYNLLLLYIHNIHTSDKRCNNSRDLRQNYSAKWVRACARHSLVLLNSRETFPALSYFRNVVLFYVKTFSRLRISQTIASWSSVVFLRLKFWELVDKLYIHL